VRRFADAVITVDDDEIVNAVLWTFANAKLVAEPSGAATIAAVLYGALDRAVDVKGPVVAIVSGGNMGIERLAEFVTIKGKR
jgi:threonine dehydratase